MWENDYRKSQKMPLRWRRSRPYEQRGTKCNRHNGLCLAVCLYLLQSLRLGVEPEEQRGCREASGELLEHRRL